MGGENKRAARRAEWPSFVVQGGSTSAAEGTRLDGGHLVSAALELPPEGVRDLLVDVGDAPVADHHLPRQLRALPHDLLLAVLRILGPILRPGQRGPRGLRQISGRTVYISVERSEQEGERAKRERVDAEGRTHAAFSSPPPPPAAAAAEPFGLPGCLLASSLWLAAGPDAHSPDATSAVQSRAQWPPLPHL